MGHAGQRLTLSDDIVRRLRARAQRLGREAAASAYETVRHLGGVPAQWMPSTPLVMRARIAGGDPRDLHRARLDDRSVVRTWAMRGTLHLLAADDVGWMIGLLGPIASKGDRRRRLQLGLDDDAAERGAAAIAAILEERGPQTRAELVEALAVRGIALGPDPQAAPHLLGYAAWRGLICFGPDRDGGEASYVRVPDWIGSARPTEPDAALAELARRYLGAFGPAGVADLAAWSGIGRKRARRAMELIAGELRDAGGGSWLLRGAPVDAAPVPTTLLPLFDPYLLGYESRDLILDAARGARVRRGGGYIRPTVLAGGRIAGTWSHERRGGRLEIAVEPFGPLEDAVWEEVAAEVAGVGRYLGTDAVMRRTDPP